jgi:endonuclease/exonuclease/phosphatase
LLAEQAGYPHWRFAATYAGGVDRLRHRPRRSQVRTFGDDPLRVLEPLAPLRGFGNAILSRLPVQTWRVERLGRGVPTIVRREGGKLPYALFTASTRLMLAATLVDGVGQVPLNVASVHLATHPTTARRQLAHAWWKLAGLPGAHILGGDMNMDDVALARIGVGRQLGQGVTFPSAAPSRRIDHFLTDALPPLGAVGQAATAVQGQPVAVAPGTSAAAVAGASAQGVSAAPSQGTPASGAPAGGPSAQAVDSGTFKLAISDHLVTWVDLEF